jgi:hypothetical protein
MNTINDNKYSKEHLNDIDNILTIEIPNIDNYYIDKVYKKICYKNKEGKWMYCKKIQTKPGYIAMYNNGQYTEVNEKSLINKIIPPTETQIQKKLFKEDKRLKERDGRYNVGVDKGIMSTQTIELPIKQKEIVEKVLVLSNADKQKLKQEEYRLKEVRTIVTKNLPFVIGILKGMGYIVSEANQK